jgi:hypothetical protein
VGEAMTADFGAFGQVRVRFKDESRYAARLSTDLKLNT